MVAVETQFGLRTEHRTQRTDAFFDVLRQHVASRIGGINTIGTVGLHQLALLDHILDRCHVRHHEKPDRVHAELAAHADVLFAHVRLGAVGGDAHRAGATIVGYFQIVDSANARNQ